MQSTVNGALSFPLLVASRKRVLDSGHGNTGRQKTADSFCPLDLSFLRGWAWCSKRPLSESARISCVFSLTDGIFSPESVESATGAAFLPSGCPGGSLGQPTPGHCGRQWRSGSCRALPPRGSKTRWAKEPGQPSRDAKIQQRAPNSPALWP